MKTKDEIMDGIFKVVEDCDPAETMAAVVEFLACVTATFIDCANGSFDGNADEGLLKSVHGEIEECVKGIIVCATAKKGGVEA